MAAMAEDINPFHQVLARRLVSIFLAWKALLLLFAALCPGPGYDTSALILLNHTRDRYSEFKKWSHLSRFTLNYLRWDALYFVKAADRGYVFEQEWAFSRAYSLVLETAAQLISRGSEPSLHHYVWAGIVVSSFCHLISVLVLFRLLNVVSGRQQNGRLPFIASVLHIVTPGGVFLCSPYAEAFFAMINFTGMLHYAQARSAERSSGKQTIREDAQLLSSGVLFAVATCIRSNGLLSGLIYLHDATECIPAILSGQLSKNDIRRLAVTCVAGSFVAIGFVVPQYIAYDEFCTTKSGSEARPWCHRTLPSIYTWVQSEYWNVGIFRYWTLSNVPLFLLAAPMLCLLFQSGVAHLRSQSKQPSVTPLSPSENREGDTKVSDTAPCHLPQLALPQLVLAVMAATSFHVQVINRLSSGYPLWYLSVAMWFIAQEHSQGKGDSKIISQSAIRGMVMYAIIQGTLFAGFLPPA